MKKLYVVRLTLQEWGRPHNSGPVAVHHRRCAHQTSQLVFFNIRLMEYSQPVTKVPHRSFGITKLRSSRLDWPHGKTNKAVSHPVNRPLIIRVWSQVPLHSYQGIFFEKDAHSAIDVKTFACRHGVDVIPSVAAKRVDVDWLPEDIHDLSTRHAWAEFIDHALGKDIALIDSDLVNLRDAETWHGDTWQATAPGDHECDGDEVERFHEKLDTVSGLTESSPSIPKSLLLRKREVCLRSPVWMP